VRGVVAVCACESYLLMTTHVKLKANKALVSSTAVQETQ